MLEAVRFGISKQTLILVDGHALSIGKVKAHFTAGFIENTTAETKDIIKYTKFLARWFAKSGSEPSILAAWGLRP